MPVGKMSSKWYEAVTTACTSFGNYVEDILATKLPNIVVLMPSDKVKHSLLLVERLSSDIWYCPEDDDAAKLNMNGVVKAGKEDCKHTFAGQLLADMTKEKDLDLSEKDQVFVVETKPSFVAVVYPNSNRCDSKGAQARPGVIQKTPKMSKHRCHTCKGREGCYHLVVFNLAKDEDTKVNNLESDRLAEKENSKRKTNVGTDLIEDDANLDGSVAPKAKSKKLNLLNPANFSGAEANVFRQNFE